MPTNIQEYLDTLKDKRVAVIGIGVSKGALMRKVRAPQGKDNG